MSADNIKQACPISVSVSLHTHTHTHTRMHTSFNTAKKACILDQGFAKPSIYWAARLEIKVDDDDDELMLNVLRYHETY